MENSVVKEAVFYIRKKIKAVKTGNNGYHQDVPVEPVIIEKAVVA